jgi:hypothetical protein
MPAVRRDRPPGPEDRPHGGRSTAENRRPRQRPGPRDARGTRRLVSPLDQRSAGRYIVTSRLTGWVTITGVDQLRFFFCIRRSHLRGGQQTTSWLDMHDHEAVARCPPFVTIGSNLSPGRTAGRWPLLVLYWASAVG